MNRLPCVSILLFAASALAPAQDVKKQEAGAHPGVDQKRVNRAIRQGVEFLKTAPSPGHNASDSADTLILLTYVHAGSEATPRFKELFDKMMLAPLKDTYSVSLQAMVL